MSTPALSATTAAEVIATLENTAKLIQTARAHFPKSIRNKDRYQLELLCAQVGFVLMTAKSEIKNSAA